MKTTVETRAGKTYSLDVYEINKRTKIKIILKTLTTHFSYINSDVIHPTKMISELILLCWLKINLQNKNLYSEKKIKRSQKYIGYNYLNTSTDISPKNNQIYELSGLHYSVFNTMQYYGTTHQLYKFKKWLSKCEFNYLTKVSIAKSYERSYSEKQTRQILAVKYLNYHKYFNRILGKRY